MFEPYMRAVRERRKGPGQDRINIMAEPLRCMRPAAPGIAQPPIGIGLEHFAFRNAIPIADRAASEIELMPNLGLEIIRHEPAADEIGFRQDPPDKFGRLHEHAFHNNRTLFRAIRHWLNSFKGPRPRAKSRLVDPIEDFCSKDRSSSGNRLDPDGGPIGQNLGDPIHDLIGVIAHAEHSIGAGLARVFAHMVESLLPGAFGQMRIGADLAPEKRLDAAKKITHDAARANRYAARHPEMTNDSIACDVIGRGYDHEAPDRSGLICRRSEGTDGSTLANRFRVSDLPERNPVS